MPRSTRVFKKKKKEILQVQNMATQIKEEPGVDSSFTCGDSNYSEEDELFKLSLVKTESEHENMATQMKEEPGVDSNFTCGDSNYSEDDELFKLSLIKTESEHEDEKKPISSVDKCQQASAKSVSTSSQETVNKLGPSSKRKRPPTVDDILSSALSVLQGMTPSNNDADDNFGKFIASELRNIKNKCLKLSAKHAIHKAIAQAQLKDKMVTRGFCTNENVI